MVMFKQGFQDAPKNEHSSLTNCPSWRHQHMASGTGLRACLLCVYGSIMVEALSGCRVPGWPKLPNPQTFRPCPVRRDGN